MAKFKKTRPIIVSVPSWPTLIMDLIRAGYPKSQIAFAACCSRETIYGILNRGAMPTWDVGQALLSLYESADVS